MGSIGKAIKKAVKGIGGLLGFGSVKTPSTQTVATDPTPTSVQDVSGDSGSNTDAKKKRRKGFASTQTTILGDLNGGGNTLG